jgi:hypothetical protein
MGRKGPNKTFLLGEAVDPKHPSKRFWNAVRPKAVAINVMFEPVDFRGKEVVGAMRGGGMVFALEWIAKNYDKFEGGVSKN